jgi:pimeloyl-ACP methyl ester carboxylesterase
MMGGIKAHYDGIVAFSQTDFTEDLKKFTVPTLVMHGDDDQIVPYVDSGPLSAKLVKGAVLKTYKGFPHGMPTTKTPTTATMEEAIREVDAITDTATPAVTRRRRAVSVSLLR